MLNHLLGDFDVGDHAIAQRTQGADAFRRLAQHQFRLIADGLDMADARDRLDRYDGRLVQDDALAGDVNQRVDGAQIDREIMAGKAEKAGKLHTLEIVTE
ncbi:hypothetical protein M2336_002990 [Sphingobium sp. B1D7B]|nr:hypothetical protein [Sphingobium sp. B1D7B]